MVTFYLTLSEVATIERELRAAYEYRVQQASQADLNNQPRQAEAFRLQAREALNLASTTFAHPGVRRAP